MREHKPPCGYEVGVYNGRLAFGDRMIAGGGELADTPDLGSGASRHGGSSPLARSFSYDCVPGVQEDCKVPGNAGFQPARRLRNEVSALHR